MTKEQRLKKRYSAEKRFKAYGIISVCAALLFVGILVFKVFSEGSGAFVKTAIQLELDLSKEKLNLPEKPTKEDFENIDFYDFAQQHILKIYPAISTKE